MHLRYYADFMTKLSVIGNMIFRAEMSLLRRGGGEDELEDGQKESCAMACEHPLGYDADLNHNTARYFPQ